MIITEDDKKVPVKRMETIMKGLGVVVVTGL